LRGEILGEIDRSWNSKVDCLVVLNVVSGECLYVVRDVEYHVGKATISNIFLKDNFRVVDL
jgi:hypothetical protein